MKEIKEKKVEELLEREDPAEYGGIDLGDGSYDTTSLVVLDIRDGDLIITDGYGDPVDVSDLGPVQIVEEMKRYAEAA